MSITATLWRKHWILERNSILLLLGILIVIAIGGLVEVVPLFYHHDDDGIPRKWIAMMKRAIQTLAPQYNSDRMVEEYARKIYPQITQIR